MPCWRSLRPARLLRVLVVMRALEPCAATGRDSARAPAFDGQRLAQMCDADCSIWPPPFSRSRPKDIGGNTVCTESRGNLLQLSLPSISPGATMPYYSSSFGRESEDAPSAAKVVVVIIHGALRNPEAYFCMAGRGPLRHHAYYHADEMLLVALKFQTPKEEPAPGEVYFNGSSHLADWVGGGDSDPRSGAMVSSFTVADELVAHFGSNKKVYPDVSDIVFMGHSAGGQWIQLYSLVTRMTPPANISVRFIAGNPSSYAYLTKHRWAYDVDPVTNTLTSPVYRLFKPRHGRRGWGHGGLKYRNENSSFRYSPNATAPRAFICRRTKFNEWKYGLENPVPYISSNPDIAGTIRGYPWRMAITLVGSGDVCSGDVWAPDGILGFCEPECFWRHGNPEVLPLVRCDRVNMDMTCPAMLQGPYRFLRGKLYMQHLKHYFARKSYPGRFPMAAIVRGMGHEDFYMMNSSLWRLALYRPRELETAIREDPSIDLSECPECQVYEAPVRTQLLAENNGQGGPSRVLLASGCLLALALALALAFGTSRRRLPRQPEALLG